MFVAAIVFFIGFLAIVVDVTWYWMNTLKVQRASDAAALAGAVKLPDYPSQARTLAFDEAKKNGYTTGVGGATVTAAQNATRDIQLDTSVSAPVDTFFMRLFGITTITATARSAAELVLPVTKGSPLNYFGVYGSLRTPTGWTRDASDPMFPTFVPAAVWTNPSSALLDETIPQYATVTNFTGQQSFGNFRLDAQVPTNVRTSGGRMINGGIQVLVRGRALTTGCFIGADLSWNGGSSWTTSGSTPANPSKKASLTTTDSLVTIGLATIPATNPAGDLPSWWGHSWQWTELSDANFQVRLQAQGGAGCSTGTTISVDSLSVVVTYQIPDPNVAGPSKEVLGPQGSWAGVLGQGSNMANGDPYSTQENQRSPSSYAPRNYYDYAIEMQPGTSGGKVSIFDPVFCATAGPSNNAFGYGMGDHLYTAGTSSANVVSTFYDIYDTNNTPYDLTDDTWIAGTSGSASSPDYHRFSGVKGYDSSMWDSSNGVPSGYSSSNDCKKGSITDPTNPLYWHNRWWTLADGLAGPSGASPRVYRIHVTSTDPADASYARNANALNNFSFFATIPGHTCPASPADPACPRVFGLGSMVAFSPLPQSQATVMYLAQIGTAYAGKTMKVQLYDPGDTNGLTATLRFLKPTASGYTPATFSYTASQAAASGASACNSRSGTNVTSVVTANGSTSYFNGCWLTIMIPLVTSYVAATPAGEPGPGWWKIQYTMGAGSAAASDLTTWKTQMIGNPVHLVTP